VNQVLADKRGNIITTEQQHIEHIAHKPFKHEDLISFYPHWLLKSINPLNKGDHLTA